MRILGADSFVGRTTSINAIPVNVLKHHDLCIAKIEDGNVDYIPAVYFLEYITNDGNAENIPYVIVPLDNQDGSDDGGRWKLKNIFVKTLHTESIYTNAILAEFPGVPITIGDTFTVAPSGVIVDGQVTVTSELTVPPFIVNSPVLVNNLNAEFICGEGTNSFLRNYNFQTLIPSGVSELDVYFAHNVLSPPSYSVFIDICNTSDTSPSIYGYVITKKEQGFFTIKFSGIIDSPNYVLHYFITGEVATPYTPPISPQPGSGAINWNSVTFDVTMVPNNGYLVNTSVDVITLKLPLSPAFGTRVDVADSFGTFATNNCIINRNGEKIMGLLEDFVCDLNKLYVSMVYFGTTNGWRIVDYITG